MMKALYRTHMKACLMCLGLACMTACHKEGHTHNESEEEQTHNHPASAGLVEMSTEEAQLVGVKTIKAEASPFVEALTVGGRIVASPGETFTLTATTPGIIRTHASMTPGTAVTRGQTLFTLSSDRMIDGDPVKKSGVAFETAKAEYERKTRLLAQKIVTQSEWNAARERYETARIAYEATMEKAGKDGHGIAAPTSGYVVACMVNNGSYVNAGEAVAVIEKGDKMILEAYIPLRHQQLALQCKGAYFLPEGGKTMLDTDSLHATLLTTPKGLRADEAYLTLRWEMARAEEAFPGSYATVHLKGAARENALTLPAEALTEESGTYYIYVKTGATHYEKRRVVKGATDGTRIEIVRGLKAGETVAVDGVAAIRQAAGGRVVEAHSHNH